MNKFFLFLSFCLIFGISSLTYGQFYPGGMGGGAMPLWLLPDQAYTTGVFPYPAPTNGNDVQIWVDNALLVGGSNNATQPTAARRPNYNNTGLFTINPPVSSSVLFDRANTEWLQIADDNSLNILNHDQKAITMAFRASSVAHPLQIIFEEGGSTNGMAIYLLGNELYVAIWSQSNGWTNVAGSTLFTAGDDYRFFRATITANTDYLVTLLFDNNFTNTYRAFLNGTQMTVTDNVVRNSFVTAYLNGHSDDTGIGSVNGSTRLFDSAVGFGSTATIPASGSFFDGRIGEITYYNNGSNVARKIVENYYSTKYQFTLAGSDMFPENFAFRSQMIGIGQETTNVTGDRISSNVQSSGGFFIENVNFFKDLADYVFAAHNSAVGSTPLGLGEYSNRLWLVEVTDVNNNDGDVRVQFDLGGLSLASPACVNSAAQYYLRINGVNTRLGLGTYNPITQTISFVVPASEIDGAQITIGVNDTSLPSSEAGLCNNGCDDDGDGLVDCYDNDCNGNAAVPDPLCEDYYYGQIPPDCVLATTPDPTITTTIQFETDITSFEVEQRGGVFIGDVVPDTWANYPNTLTLEEKEHAEVVAKNPFLDTYTAGPKIGQNRFPHIYIYSGDDGTMLQRIPTPTTDPFSMLALGDVDRNGNGDIFITGSDRRIYRYEFNPAIAFGGSQAANSHLAQSTVLVLDTEMTPALADFDQNGVPEVYVGNAIYNSLTLASIIAPNAALSSGMHPNDNNAAFPVAFDIFSPSDIVPATGMACGGDCQGLELVTGNRIYAVNLSTGTLRLLSSAPAPITDGRASIADMDNDGRVDVVTCGYDYVGTNSGAIFIWNPRTQTQMANTFKLINGGQTTTVGGRPNLADIDGDRMLEIVVGGRNRLYAIETDSDGDGFFGPALALKWVGITDETSDRTSGSTFDFNGDGNAEVIYSDEENLLIYNGTTGAIVTSVTSYSGTRSEYPIIADVDKDGLSELIVTSQNANGPDNNAVGRVTVYASGSGSPWVSSRPVWNQHTYFVTNVEDDLTIPAVQQNHILPGYVAGPPAQSGPLNSFIKQVSSFDNDNNSLTPTGDLQIIALSAASVDAGGSVDYSLCLAFGIIRVSVTVRNNGDANVTADTPITFYDANPYVDPLAPLAPAANVLAVLPVGQIIPPDGADVTLTFDINVNGGNINMYVLGNIDGNVEIPKYTVGDSDIYDKAECKFDNNDQNVDIGPCLLPIELIELYAENLAEKVVVHWATASELDNDYFLVERAGTDLQFRAIGKVVGKGTKNERTDYLFNDYEPLLGVSYYRLKQVDYDGTWTNTKVVSVTRTTNNLPPALYPNPNQAGRELYMRGLVDASMIKQLRIISITGQQVTTPIPVKTSVDGIVVISLPQNLSKGIYILNVATDFGVENFKFVIE